MFARLPPLSASPWRAVAEAAAACAVLLLLGAASTRLGSHAGPVFSGLLVVGGWVMLCVWPAWRLRPIQRRGWWVRIALGLGRALLLILALGIAAVVLTRLELSIASFWPAEGFRFSRVPMLAAPIAAGFGLTRLSVHAGTWALAWTRLRLRRQLMASHVMVIVLTIATLTALGSAAGIGIALHAVHPNSIEMATSVREELELTARPTDPRQVQRVFLAIVDGKLPQRGQPPLSFLVGSAAVPQGLVLLTPHGEVLAAVETRKGTLFARRWSDIPGLGAVVWDRLRAASVAGRAYSVRIHFPNSGPGERSDLAEVPVRNSRGRTEGVLLVATGGPTLTSRQFFQALILLFGATTVILVSIAAAPLLALSFVFSYLTARGLTHRLEAVSRVAAAVASGNFRERAPVNSHDEVGQLAQDLNQMAGRLERLVGELTQARSQAEEALSMRRELVANVSHELRTPLAVLSAQLESIAARDMAAVGGSRDDEVRIPASTIEVLRGETVRLASMIDDLFALSRADTGSLQLELEPVNVGAVVDEVARFMRPLAQRESAVTLSADVPPGLPAVRADPRRVHQILSNLVRNAIRYTPEGGIVVLSAHREGDWVSIWVADTGEGVRQEDLPHLFERFFRADPSRTRETGGAGLGLAIVRDLVELMGGSVSVESAPNLGSRFTVSFPVY